MSADRTDNYPLTADEVHKLAIFNSQVAEGLVHRPGYAFEMAKLQEKVDVWTRQQNDWAAAQPGSVRINATSPHVSGGASTGPDELRVVSEEIDENYRRDLVSDVPRHVHNFDRLHRLCRCGERAES